MTAPLDDVCLFCDGPPAMMMPIFAMPYLLDDAFCFRYAHLLNNAWLLGDAYPA